MVKRAYLKYLNKNMTENTAEYMTENATWRQQVSTL
jgi:hypothetical protein